MTKKEELDPGGPERTAFSSIEEFEAKILEGLSGPGRVMTDADWDEILQRFLNRHGIKEMPDT